MEIDGRLYNNESLVDMFYRIISINSYHPWDRAFRIDYIILIVRLNVRFF